MAESLVVSLLSAYASMAGSILKPGKEVERVIFERMGTYADMLKGLDDSNSAVYRREMERLRDLLQEFQDIHHQYTRANQAKTMDRLDAIDREFTRQYMVISTKISIERGSAGNMPSPSPASPDGGSVPDGEVDSPRSDVQHPLDTVAELLGAQDGGNMPTRGTMPSGFQSTEGQKSGSNFREMGKSRKGREGRSAAVKDALGSVAISAQAIAESSSIPFVPEIAASLKVLTNICSDFKEHEQNMAKTVRWCESMLKILDESTIHTVVREDVSGPVADLLEGVRDDIAEIVKIVTCFRRKGKLGRVCTSTLYKRKLDTAESCLRQALERLQAATTFVSAATLDGIKTGVDQLLARSEGVEKRLSRQERKKRLLERNEIPPDQITYFDDMVLGEGGFANVQLVEYQDTFLCAAKVVRMPEAEDTRATEKVTRIFVNELHAMVELRSQYTVNVFGAVTSVPGKLVLVMEFVEGGDLRAFLSAGTDPLENSLAHDLTRDIAKGMQFLHSKNAIHGDLKSPNVLLTRDKRPKIADFGSTRTMEKITSIASNPTRRGTTLNWSAPEVLNLEAAQAKSDVYSFGVVVWEIVSRQLPWDDFSRKEVIASVLQGKRPEVPTGAPPLLASLIRNCWAHKPEERMTFDGVLVMLKYG